MLVSFNLIKTISQFRLIMHSKPLYAEVRYHLSGSSADATKTGKGNEEQAMKPFTFSFDHCDLQKDKQTNKQK